MKLLHIIADAHIWGVESAFSSLPGYDVDLRVLEHGDICRESLKNADILLTRSSTQVNAGLLDGTPVRFVATATIGDDHYDKAYLKRRGIAFANAAGSSTGSVIEYMLAALFELRGRGLISLPGMRLGIIGAGRIGGGLAQAARVLGMEVLLNDPPRAEAEGKSGFLELAELLAQADIISLHTPLTRGGAHPTHHLIGPGQLERFTGHGLINAGRGAVVDNVALADWLDADNGRFSVLDCWEHEPDISCRLLAHPRVALATPHIAGHSLDGKAANTQFVHNALCRFLGVASAWNMHDHLPSPEPSLMHMRGGGDARTCLQQAVRTLYDIRADDERLRQLLTLPVTARSAAFVRLRRHYPVRRAWHISAVHFDPADREIRKLASAIGLRVV